MPIMWGVNHAARLVSAKATGELSKTDIEDYLDMAESWLALSGDDMAALGTRIRSHESAGPMGSVAVIAVADEVYDQFRLFESVVHAQRQLRVFRNAEMAYAWLTVGLPEGRERAETWRIAARPPTLDAA
jgi:hypothetical protein